MNRGYFVSEYKTQKHLLILELCGEVLIYLERSFIFAIGIDIRNKQAIP